MRVVAPEEVVSAVGEAGGRVYVWPRRSRCCGGLSRLVTSTTQPPDRVFRRVETDERFEVYVPDRLGRLPDELHLAVRRFPRRIEAYWNGCAWIV